MSLDLKAVRYDIAAVVRLVSLFRFVDEYERRDRDLAMMPFAQVWRDEVEGPPDNDAMAEFGKYAYTVTWRVRCYTALNDDVESQDSADALAAELRAAFDPRPTLISQTVDIAKLVRVESIPIIDGVQTPVMLVEGTLVTEITA